MESDSIKLTLKGLEGLRAKCKDGQTFRETMELQYLGKEQLSDNIILSDGHLKENFALYKSIKEDFLKKPPPTNCVIQAETILHKGVLFILSEYTVLHRSQVFPEIGAPIKYSEFTERGSRFNENATNKLSLNDLQSKDAKNNDNTPEGKNQQGSKYQEDEFTPIKLLSPANSSWRICARLQSKGPVKTFSKKNEKGGEGKIANCLFLDNSSRI